MIWLLRQGPVVLFRGTYRAALHEADRRGLISHVAMAEDDEGVKRPRERVGRGQHDDGTELPPRIARGFSIMPDAQRAQSRRTAA